MFTASKAKEVLGLTSTERKTNYFRENLWRIGGFQGNEATRYGQNSEPEARKCYLQQICKKYPGAQILTTGNIPVFKRNTLLNVSILEKRYVSVLTCRPYEKINQFKKFKRLLESEIYFFEHAGTQM